ncbi:hypothetical protein C8Q76DRAFT_723759 [Earliella scabrosa]|nr:hypothetical protein C8Q76DRAFT_723759 [Earliella scabrosa]
MLCRPYTYLIRRHGIAPRCTSSLRRCGAYSSGGAEQPSLLPQDWYYHERAGGPHRSVLASVATVNCAPVAACPHSNSKAIRLRPCHGQLPKVGRSSDRASSGAAVDSPHIYPPLPHALPLFYMSTTNTTVAAHASKQDLLHHTYGVILVAGLLALFLSGAVFAQVVVYFRLYPTDDAKIKGMVLLLFVLDITHSAMICTANWQNLMTSFGNYGEFSRISWSIATTIAITATTTFIAHCFFTNRIHGLSNGRWIITAPLLTLALARLVSGLVTTGEMGRLRDFGLMLEHYEYLLTLGLAIATATDVLITIFMCFYLRRRRSGLSRTDRVVNELTLFAVETGMLTSLTTVLSLFFWLRTPENLVFMGLHLNICKLYANSILARYTNCRCRHSPRDADAGRTA